MGRADNWTSFHNLSVITFTHDVLLDRGLVKLTPLLRTGHVNYILDEYSLISSVWEIMCWTTNWQSVGGIHDEIHYHVNSIPHESFDLSVSELQLRRCFCKQTALYVPMVPVKSGSNKVGKCKTLVIWYQSQSWCQYLLDLLYC